MAPIIDKLAKARGMPILSKRLPKKSGVYTINQTGMPCPLYAGMTNNLNRRMNEHTSLGTKSRIQQHLSNTDLGKVRTKFVPVRNPGTKERQVIKSIKKKYGKQALPFNRTKGNATARKRKRIV